MALHKKSVVLQGLTGHWFQDTWSQCKLKQDSLMGTCWRKVSIWNQNKEIYWGMLPPIWHLSDPTPRTSPVKSQAAEGRQAAETALLLSWEGTYQWRTFFSGLLWPFSLEDGSHAPHEKNCVCLRCQKQLKDQKLFLVQTLLLTSAVFWENSLTPGIKESAIYIWIVFEITLYAQEMQRITARLAIEIISVLYHIKGPGHCGLWFPLL